MIIHLPDDLENYVRNQARGGRYLDEDDVVRDALERHRRAEASSIEMTEQAERAPDDVSDQELQRRLFEAGVLSEIKPPIADLSPYRDRRAVPIQGEPISETAIRERR